MKRLLTTGEAAAYCGVHLRTVLRWIERGHLKSHRLPGLRGDNRIQLDDFIQFLEQHQMPVPPELAERTRRVLVIDDERNVANAIRRVLRKAGYEVEVATSGVAAGLKLAAWQPSLVTLDLRMPGMSGFDVLKLIRATAELRGMKVLVISGLPPEQLEQARLAGADGVLGKPFEGPELVQEISRLLGRPHA